MQTVIPALRIRSYQVIKPFYESLGFKEQWIHQFEPHFPTFAAMARDGMQIFLTEHTGDCQFGGLVHFRVGDVDAVCAEFVAQGVVISEAPNNDINADLRMLAVVDPDGNRLKFMTVKRA